MEKTDKKNEIKKYTLLIVDDLEINRQMLKSILSNEYNIEEADNGEDALKIIKDHGGNINLIISDNHMKIMDGMELLEHLSSNPWYKKIPVIMMSSDQSREFVNRAYELGAADFFFTPFVPLLVKHRIRYTLENAQRHKEELLNSVHCFDELYFVLMQIDLERDTCEIVDTSENLAMWDKEITLCASKTIKLFTEHGYIHPDDLQKFLEFTAPKNLQKKFLSGMVKTHFRYRRKYQGNYRWALMEVIRTQDYSENHQSVVMFSRDIQEIVENQHRTMEVVSDRAILSDYCNITQNYLYHNEKSIYIDSRMQTEFDTITQIIEWGASKIPDLEIRESYLKLLSRENLIETFNKGQHMVFIEHPYRTPKTGIKLFRTSVQMFRSVYTKDIEAIFYVEDIGKKFIQRRIAENVFYDRYAFVGVWDMEYKDIYIYKSGENLYHANDSIRVLYQDVVDYRLNRQSLTKEEYLEKISPETVMQKLEETDKYTFTLDILLDNGRPCTLEYMYSYFMSESKLVSVLVRDITEEVEQDKITRGMNRKGFILESEWFLSKNNKQDYAILYFDIQAFKAINELLGFEEGNKMLAFVCKMINESELHPVFTARVMADQFVCLVLRSNIKEDVLSTLCRTEIKKHMLPIVLRMHCGIYEINEEDTDVRSMCDKAKIALNKIENEFTNPYIWFEDNMNKQYLNQLKVVNNISNALENKEFVVYYQPIYDAKTKQLVSAEALVRWHGENKEYIYPNVFIPILEEKGIISQLDWYVTTEVHNFIQKQKANGLPYVPVSINLSQRDFYNKQILWNILNMLENTKIDKTNLRFEITESAFADVNQLDRDFLKKVREMGSKILIDDFGTGYSSLSSVSKQKFDVLKMDMSFVREIGENEQTEAVIQSIIDMAHRMKAVTVAEGVETEKQYQFLKENGCDFIQGYYFSKPLPMDEFKKILHKEYFNRK